MQWWRKNDGVMFVPVDIAKGRGGVEDAARIVDSMRGLGRGEWKRELEDPKGVNVVTREENSIQGGKMRTYISEEGRFLVGGDKIKAAVQDAAEWRSKLLKYLDL